MKVKHKWTAPHWGEPINFLDELPKGPTMQTKLTITSSDADILVNVLAEVLDSEYKNPHMEDEQVNAVLELMFALQHAESIDIIDPRDEGGAD